MPELTLMERVALTRLRRFERVAEIAEQSDSPIWQRLAKQAATAAYRDCLLVGLNDQKIDKPESARAA